MYYQYGGVVSKFISDPLFHIIPFICGIIVGLLLLVYYKTPKIVIIDYPKPNDNKVYTDHNGVKYMFETKEVSCDENEFNLKYYPLQ
jgi:hypothetical protein